MNVKMKIEIALRTKVGMCSHRRFSVAFIFSKSSDAFFDVFSCAIFVVRRVSVLQQFDAFSIAFLCQSLDAMSCTFVKAMFGCIRQFVFLSNLDKLRFDSGFVCKKAEAFLGI